MQKLLHTLSKANEEATLARQGKYICKFCGLLYKHEDKLKHETKCWGRCQRCLRKKLPCDCGTGPTFSRCDHCKKKNFSCDKLAGTRQIAKSMSILPENA
jgi:hypothetical protein